MSAIDSAWTMDEYSRGLIWGGGGWRGWTGLQNAQQDHLPCSFNVLEKANLKREVELPIRETVLHDRWHNSYRA